MSQLRNEVEIAKKNAVSKGFSVVQDNEKWIGFRQSDWVFYWFRIYTMLSGEVMINFDHIYSQTTGGTSKSLRRGLEFTRKLGIYE
jgi:hypothetical protein